MYDGRKIERPETTFPLFNSYVSDWHQLYFYYNKISKGYDKEGNEVTYREYGHYSYSEDQFGNLNQAVIGFNLALGPDPEKNLDIFIKHFNFVWLHEYMHLVGFSEIGLNYLRKMGFPV